MSRKSYPNVNAANQYARDVVRGKIVACQFVIQACQRHLDDLMAEKSKSFRYRFDKDLAERAAKFIQLLPHTKGEWAFKRMPITLEPWQLFVICCAFGWVNKGSRLRRFREVYTEIPRKNGKSAISAGVALYCFACDNEFGAEVYSGATTEKQAWEVFRPARLMCKRTPMLTEAFGIEVNASNMNRPEDGARFEPLIGNPGDGSSPHCAVVDEYHEHATDALYTTMLTGMGARRQPLMWAITTAGYNIEGPCYDKRREVIEMLNGSVPNDELFGIIYTVDEGDDWTDPQVLEKANPNIGVSVYREFLLSQQQRAKNNARLANVFKTKHLNIWVSARSAYFNLVSWQSCEDKSLTLEQFEGQPCILAFDLARKLDMNSMARLYTREIDGKTHYYSVAPRFWVPYDTVYSVEKNEDRRTAERFQKWVEMGVLTVTDGAEVDYRYILEEAKAANKISPVSESPIDPFGATGLSHDLADEDLNPITIIQNYTNMSDPMKELEAAIESGRFHHDGNPIMTWCIGNVVGKTIPGTVNVYVGRTRVQAPVTNGDNVATIASSIQDAINAVPALPFTASSSAGVVTLTARHKGLCGNEIPVSLNYYGFGGGEVLPAGVQIAVATGTAGTGSPVLTGAVAAMADEPFDYIGLPFNDTASVNTLVTEMNDTSGRWSYARQLYGHVYTAKIGTLSELVTAGDQFNQQHITLAGYEKETQTPADELAASRTARAAVFIRNDPARPTQTGELVGMLPAPKGKRFTMTEQQTLLSHGVATAYVESGVLRIQRDVTTYRKNAYGVADSSYR
ncbi:phage tail sheath subtilisin-like domain-containing protein [Escherichia coli]|nr:phage tail sheath subtilisin-like domain-containing protein [Escherichia coli]